ncbi:MAG: TonB-dependent receptor plug domain-containing protein [Candidatus Cloacimonas sp.]|jgi:iron complex outermembrane receptor protein|nr:TonB-dependent receptor plug domain-containing protein [Candidatus Cloacimonas sp.]
MRKLTISLILIFCSILLNAKPAPDSLKTFTLPTIRVIVDKPSEAIGSLIQIRTGDNEAALSMLEAFSNSVGISASTGTKDESNIRLRGFRKNEVKIMLDGRPLNNGYFGNVDLSKLSLMGIQEIQIIKGPASPLYGTNSMGGVVNIITNEPSKRNWLTLNAMLKRNNTQEYQANTAHSFETWNYSLGASTQQSQGFVLSEDFQPTSFENGGVRNNSAKKQYNLRGSLNSELFTFHKISVDFGYSTISRKDIPSSIYERKYRFYKDWHRNYASLAGEFNLGEKAVLTTMLTNDGGGDRYLEYNDPAHLYINVDSRMNNQSWGFAPRVKWSPNNTSTLHFGYHAELQSSNRKDTVDYLEWTQSTVQVHNAFAQYELHANNKLLVTAAMGLTGSKNDFRPALQLIPEPALGISYTGTSGSVTSLAVGRNSAQPTMRQLYSYSKGNPELKAQNSLKLELNHERSLIKKAVSVSGSVYYNYTRDLIDLYLERYANIYRVVSYGAEMGLIFSPFAVYQCETNYAFLNYQKESDYRLTETPKHAVEFAQRIKLPLKINALISSSWRDKRMSQDDLGIYHSLPAYWKHDLQLKVPYSNYSFVLGLENILDADYQGEFGFPEAGRNFSIGAEAKF